VAPVALMVIIVLHSIQQQIESPTKGLNTLKWSIPIKRDKLKAEVIKQSKLQSVRGRNLKSLRPFFFWLGGGA